MGDQIWNVLQDITDMGNVPMLDPDIGWKVELANYKGTFPHSHTKFIVVDGKTMMAGGFNIAWVHLPKNDISGKGDDMTDLGITISGPIAQTGIEVFDEMWQGANQLVCDDPLPATLRSLQNACTWETATVSHIPDSLKYYLPGDTDTALACTVSADYKESDDAMHAVLQSAQDSIDILHANFTAELICDVNMVFPGVCNYNNSLPFMRSLVSAMEDNGVMVRVLVEETNMNGMENRVGLRILQDELARRGLANHLEVRLFDGRLHTKSVLIDNRLLIIGSHLITAHSRWKWLNEFNRAIDSSAG
jgi:phosphatidylserine/phosphatidylglycerophosphate/cardiolipin synthase-like enzyme